VNIGAAVTQDHWAAIDDASAGAVVESGVIEPTIPEITGGIGWFMEAATSGTAKVMLRMLV
jgi:hypothetical protein